MIALDTNIIVRFLARDDAASYAIVETLLATCEVSVSPTVILETEWVLRSSYRLAKGEIWAALSQMLTLPNFFVQEREAVIQALKWSHLGLDLADALHLALAGHAQAFATFDSDLIQKAAPINPPIQVRNPQQLLPVKP